MIERLRHWILPALITSMPLLAGDALVVPLWPDHGSQADEQQEKINERGKDGKQDRSISGVRWPTLTVYLPPAERNTGTAIVICPGGGYGGLAIDKEGHDVARWLNTQGIAGLVLKYRLPKATGDAKDIPLPLQDARQALRIARTRAGEWKIDPTRIGVMGFSAGGHLAATLSTHFDEGKAEANDALGRASCRPDFAVLVYPVVSMQEGVGHSGSRGALIGKTPSDELVKLYSNELHVTPRTPPTFLVHARDDGVKVENSILFHEALKKAGVPSETFFFDKGGHGYGLGIRGGDAAQWPKRFVEWLSGLHAKK